MTSNAVPFTAFCPDCNAHRTFTLLPRAGDTTILASPSAPSPSDIVGCCICGTSERDALVALTARVTDDRESLGEMAARLNTLDGEVAELRDDHLDLARAHDRLYDKVRVQQDRRLLRVVTDIPPCP